MGLKTINYKSKTMGVEIPQAYAILRTLVIESDSSIHATFVIQIDRAATKIYQPIDKVQVITSWDRKSNPVEMAYEAAKTQTMSEMKYDEETGEMYSEEKFGVLYGWEDDIVE